MRALAAFALIALAGCSEELDRDVDHSNEIAEAANDIANKADEQVNAAIAKLGPLEPVSGDNAVENEAANGN